MSIQRALPFPVPGASYARGLLCTLTLRGVMHLRASLWGDAQKVAGQRSTEENSLEGSGPVVC